jgi:hypothetical protein
MQLQESSNKRFTSDVRRPSRSTAFPSRATVLQFHVRGWTRRIANVLVNERLTTPLHLSFSAATPSRIGLQQVGTIALLIHVVQLLTGESDLTIRTLSSPSYEGAVAFICAVIDNGAIRSEFPDVPADRYAAVRLAAEQQMRLYARSTIAPASPGGASLLASEIAGAIRPDKRWAFNCTSCARLAGSGKVSVLF